MFNRANVELVTEPITALCREGVRAGGETYQVQCTLGKSLNGNSWEQSYIKWHFLKKLMMETEMF